MEQMNISLNTGDAFDRMAPCTQKWKLSIDRGIIMVISASESASLNGGLSPLGLVDMHGSFHMVLEAGLSDEKHGQQAWQ
jgi:hypothetical protein